LGLEDEYQGASTGKLFRGCRSGSGKRETISVYRPPVAQKDIYGENGLLGYQK